eukprot:CAMPEP_0172492884 /NCGR_PEP_ID=MMETSP1066-20121228/24144_1 /TAXON_ID=671091 /ORGANISM="Coscinodiscus wailesii, Strain CCMP2513" /LENGTH=70 /DNA_ID=CAMNT_0013262741 /DNA_START=48 /DNA_END=260 /DNA_ORIENTATION=-
MTFSFHGSNRYFPVVDRRARHVIYSTALSLNDTATDDTRMPSTSTLFDRELLTCRQLRANDGIGGDVNSV